MSVSDSPNSPDEKLIAALTYFFGAFVAFIVWLFYKDRSRFLCFHAVQALAAGIVLMVLSFLFSMCLLPVMWGAMMFAMLSITEKSAQANFFFPFFAPMLSFVFVLPIALLGWGIRLWGAIGVFVNSNFRYPFLGRWVEKFLKE